MAKILLSLILYMGFSTLIIPTASGEAPAADQEFVAAFTSSNLVLDLLHFLRPLPGVAKRREFSEDRLVYRFDFRNNARYSNGGPVTAQDFRESCLHIINTRNKGDYSFIFDVLRGVTEYRSREQADPGTIRYEKHRFWRISRLYR
jgi:ABC-type oligopeptide transport system substrate-binding subunit